MNYGQVLEHALQNNLNVLFIGKHGCGKTSIVKQTFENAGLRWRYFSASTMDPWVDFIGVPKSVTRKDGTQVLELVKPAEFADDQVEAIFFDELNRSPKKIRNAIMELIQFKSINGKSFPNLKVIWGAINPHDDENTYDVEKMDEAQLDRFQLHINVPYKPDSKFFKETYGETGERAVRWWNGQTEAVQNLVSPRRLEYAVQMFEAGGKVHLSSVMPTQVNVSEFRRSITMESPEEILAKLSKKSTEEIKDYFNDSNNYKHCREAIFNDSNYIQSVARHLHPEVLLKEVARSNKDAPRKLIDDMMTFPDQYESVSTHIRNKPSNYTDGLGMHFDRHEQNKLLSQQAKQNVASGNLPDKIMVNGKEFETAKLNPSNFFHMTGRQFTLTQEQREDVKMGRSSRESFFPDFLKRVAENIDDNQSKTDLYDLPF